MNFLLSSSRGADQAVAQSTETAMNRKRGNKTTASIKALTDEWQYPAVWIAGLMDSVYLKALHCCTIAKHPNKYDSRIQYLLSTHSYRYAQTHCSKSSLQFGSRKQTVVQFLHLQQLIIFFHIHVYIHHVIIPPSFAESPTFMFPLSTHSHADPVLLSLPLHCRVLCCLGVSFPASGWGERNLPWGLQLRIQIGDQCSAVAVWSWSIRNIL